MKASVESKGLRATASLRNDLVHIELKDTSGTIWADGAYVYSLRPEGGAVASGLVNPAVSNRGGGIVVEGAIRDTSVTVSHSIRPTATGLREDLELTNNGDREVHLEQLGFGFTASLQTSGSTRLIACPFRRQVDNKLHDYSSDDLLGSRFSNSDGHNDGAVTDNQVCDHGLLRSEAWIITDRKRGLMVAKYNPEHIEYSMASVQDDTSGTALRFGGAALSVFHEPRGVTRLAPGQSFAFGQTLLQAIDGGWQPSYDAYRQFLNSKGHGYPADYNPPLNWNELFDVGWYHSDVEKLAEHYTRQALMDEAAKAKEIGADLLYLDPGWGVCEGTTLWDEKRLGEVEDFVREVHEKYGLKVGYRTIGRVYRDEFPDDWYLRRKDAAGPYQRPWLTPPVVPEAEGKPIDFWEVCTQSPEWQAEKIKRILAVTRAGMDFMMYDEFDWRGACYNPDHGHEIPSTPEGHARAVFSLVEKMREQFPHVLVEAHDPVLPWNVRYLPTYYRQGFSNNRFQENWGFEFMWHPIDDLKSGRAMCLYYYNLGCDIPLYDHITMESDNDACLSFWWYASTIRHLGIGGKKGLNSKTENEARWQQYKKAVAEYNRLRPYYARGRFIGIQETAHLHLHPTEKSAVLNVYNLESTPQNREVRVDTKALNLGAPGHLTVKGAESKVDGDHLVLTFNLPPESPALAEIKSAGSGK